MRECGHAYCRFCSSAAMLTFIVFRVPLSLALPHYISPSITGVSDSALVANCVRCMQNLLISYCRVLSVLCLQQKNEYCEERVCLYVCCLPAHISQNARIQTSLNFLCILPVVVARPLFGGVRWIDRSAYLYSAYKFKRVTKRFGREINDFLPRDAMHPRY